MIRSMTGFGAGRSGTGRSVVVELRATNHKYNEVRVVAPRELAFLAGPCEARIRAEIVRGAVDARITAEGDAWSRAEIDLPRAKQVHAALSALAEELTPGARVPVESLLALPDLFGSSAAAHRAELEASAATALDAALADLRRMQETEGVALAADMTGRLQRILALSSEVGVRQPEVLAARRTRLHARTRELLAGAMETRTLGDADDLKSAADAMQRRVDQEIVLLADRYDTTEEKTRLASHIAQCLGALEPGGPVPAGKRLDFLLQEVSREITTMGAKSEDAAIALLVVEMKTEAAKLREQVQNIV